MRRLFVLSIAAATIAAAALWASEQGGQGAKHGKGFALGPFEDTYALQAETGHDFKFSDGERYPGTGGAGQADLIDLQLFDIAVQCRQASYDIIAFHGVTQGGRLSCHLSPLSNPSPAVSAVDQLLAQIEGSPDWAVLRDMRDDARRNDEWGRTVRAAYRFLQDGGYGHPIDTVPLVSFKHEGGSFADIQAGINRRVDADGLRLFVTFRFESPCWSQLSAYQAADKNPDDTKPEHYAEAEQLFDGRPYSEVPVQERVAKASVYLQEGCEG